jgi:hypothetical protein
MEESMLELRASSAVSNRTLLDRVGDMLSAVACTRVWVRGAGRHVMIGLTGQEAFARVTALGAGSYGLAFQGGIDRRWEPLLVDDLRSVVEHALIGGEA